MNLERETRRIVHEDMMPARHLGRAFGHRCGELSCRGCPSAREIQSDGLSRSGPAGKTPHDHANTDQREQEDCTHHQ